MISFGKVLGALLNIFEHWILKKLKKTSQYYLCYSPLESNVRLFIYVWVQKTKMLLDEQVCLTYREVLCFYEDWIRIIIPWNTFDTLWVEGLNYSSYSSINFEAHFSEALKWRKLSSFLPPLHSFFLFTSLAAIPLCLSFLFISVGNWNP